MDAPRLFAVIGLDSFGYWLAETLSEEGFEVLAVDKKQERVQEISDKVVRAVRLDATDIKALKAIGIDTVDQVIFSIDDLEASILVAINLKDLGIQNVVAKSASVVQTRILRKIGIKEIISPEKDIAVRLAKKFIAPNIFDSLMVSEKYSIFQIKAPQIFWGKTLRHLNIRAKYGVNVIGIKKTFFDEETKNEKENLIIAPGADGLIEKNDSLLVIGENDKLKKMRSLK